jgi:hypothetical protein
MLWNCDWSLLALLFRRLPLNSSNCSRSQLSVRHVREVEAVDRRVQIFLSEEAD